MTELLRQVVLFGCPMATHSLSIVPFSLSSSSCRCGNSYGSSSHKPKHLNPDVFISLFTGPKLSIRPSTPWRNTSRRHSSTVATPASNPPTSTMVKDTPVKSAKLSARFIKSIALGENESRKLTYSKMGTEGLLMGILVEGTSLAAKKLRESGITVFKMREETVELLGGRSRHLYSKLNIALSIFAQRAIDWAINEKLKSGETGEVTTSHLLLGIWSQEESAGHRIMAKLGFDDDKAKELAKCMDKEIILNIERGI